MTIQSMIFLVFSQMQINFMGYVGLIDLTYFITKITKISKMMKCVLCCILVGMLCLLFTGMTAVTFDNVWKRDPICHQCVVETIRDPALQRDRHGVFACFVTATLKFNDTDDVKQITSPLQCPGTSDLHCEVCSNTVGTNVYCYEVLYGLCYSKSIYLASPVECSNDNDPNMRNQFDYSGGIIFLVGVTIVSWILFIYSIYPMFHCGSSGHGNNNQYQMVPPV